MNFLIGCCEKQPIRKLGQRLRSYEKENRSLIPAGDKVPILKIRRCSVKGSLSTELEPGTFKCSRKRCNTCPFITNTVSISGPKNSTQITDHFDCTSRNVIYCIRCTACNQLYIGETGRRLGDSFREHLLDVKNNSQDVSKPVARHFNQPGHSHNNTKIFGLSLHQGNTESRKCTEQRLIFKIGTLSPAGINERFSFS